MNDKLTNAQKEYLHGYTMGYEWVAYEGGSKYSWVSEVRRRGIPVKSSYGMGFRAGADDAYEGNPRKYSDLA